MRVDKVYTGSPIEQAVTVKLGGIELDPAKDYDVAYENNVNVGLAKIVSITGKGAYTGTITTPITFKINPAGTTVSKLKAAKKAFTANWKKQAKQTTGYQLQYSLKSNFKSAKTVTVSKVKTVSKKVSKLKAKKKYYVHVRTYKTVGKVKYYSAWSPTKTVKTK